jgi:hypothetical protein
LFCIQSASPFLQNDNPSYFAIPYDSKGCGCFVLNNGLFDCVLPKSAVPYFDQFGNCRLPMDNTAIETVSKSNKLKAPKIPTSSVRSRPSVGTFAMVRNIFVKEGFRGIYAGLAPTLVMGVPATVLYYTAYDEIVLHLRQKLSSTSSEASVWVPLVAGSSARLLASMVTAPLELIRTRQASMVGYGQEAAGLLADLKQIVQADGFTALYRGLGPTLWRDVPFSGIYWLCLEQFRGLCHRLVVDEQQMPSSSQQAGMSFVSGASSGMVAAACTTVG